ncbi:MAG: LUD domain-containing protein [Nitrososphaerota archaeon]|nr:LUD domain-containing protein [Aigarchaeota archaeon]MDW8076790.1 LUD domain-containing protein [Nitrososphaerota archaeon]
MKGRNLIAEVSEVLNNRSQIENLRNSMLRMKDKRDAAMAGYGEDLLAELRSVRQSALSSLNENIKILKERLERNGCSFYFAKTAKDVCEYVVSLARNKGVKRIVKAKSMTTEEIELNKWLIAEGFEVIETDLGEWLVQLAGQKPSHLTAPAIHLSRYEISKLIEEKLGVRLPADPKEVTKFARSFLREKFLTADMGITGGNILVAETGSLVLVTNEGNGRLVTTLPRIHVAIVGVEKLVGTWEDAVKILNVLSKSATGQKMATYVTILNSGSETPSQNGELIKRDFHLVLLDNGRLGALQDSIMSEALKCIRCSACFNVCPTYRVLGGHVFGYIYSGPIGIPWTYISHGLENAASYASLCISCGLCRETCPVGIDTPTMVSEIKRRYGERNGYSWVDRRLAGYESLVKLASSTSPMSNFLLSTSIMKWILEKFFGIDRRVSLPKFSKKNLRELLNEYAVQRVEGDRKVVYFADSMAYYVNTDVGLATFNVLQKNGFEVIMPPQRGSGMPSFLYGLLDVTRSIAEYNVKHVYEYVSKGYDVVSAEPTAIYCFKFVYPKLLGTKEAQAVAENSYELFGYLLRMLESNTLDLSFKRYKGVKAVYHLPCHSRHLSKDKPVLKFLEMLDIETEFVDYGCCGMGGTWGMKKGYEGYEISKVIAEPLVAAISESNANFVVTECSLCKIQIERFTNKRVIHPILLLDKAYKGLPAS